MDFSGKNPQHAFLLMGSKAADLPVIYVGVGIAGQTLTEIFHVA
jgi:hypothetical protein